MRFDLGSLIGMAIQSLPEPRKVARELLALRPGGAALWQAFALVVVLSTVAGVVSTIISPVDPEAYGPLLSNPLAMGLVEGLFMLIAIMAIYKLGQMFGGNGTFEQTLIIVIWLQFVMLMIEVLVLLVMLFSPYTASILWMVGAGAFFWLLSHFVAELHGFSSAGVVFAAIMGFFMALTLVFSLLFTMFGLFAA